MSMTNRHLLPALTLILLPSILCAQYRWESIGPDGGMGVWRIFADSSGSIYADLQKARLSERSAPVYRLDPGETVWQSLPMYDTAWRGDYNGPMVVPFGQGLIGLDGCCEIVYSDDGGRSWSRRGEVTAPNPTFEIFHPEIAVFSDTVVILPASTSSGYYWTSGDGGYTWEKHHDSDLLSVSSLYSTGKDLFALNESGLVQYKGGRWVRLGPLATGLYHGTVVSHGDTLLLSASESGNDRMSISFDFGSTWHDVSGRLSNLTWGDGAFWGGRGDSIFVLDLPSLTWDFVARTPDGERVTSLFVEDSVRYAGTSNGMVRWHKGENPAHFQSGLAGHVITYLAPGDETLFAYSADTALFSTSDGGLVWVQREFPQIGNPVGLAYGVGGLYTADRGSSRIWYSMDSGQSWKSTSIATTGASSIASIYGGGTFVTVGAEKYLVGKYHDSLPWRTYTFSAGSHVVGLGELIGNPVALVQEPTNWTFVQLDKEGTNPSFSSPPIYSPLETPMLATGGTAAYIAVNGEGVYISRDTGTSWSLLSSIPGPTANTPINQFEFIFAHDQFVLVVGRHRGVDTSPINQYAVSYDEGRTWRLIPRASNTVTDAVVADGTLYLTSFRRSVVAGRSVLTVPDGQRSREELNHNGTVLSFIDGILSVELRRAMEYEITVYDLGGNQIADIVKWNMAAGVVHLPVSRERLTSGVYVIRLAGSDGSEQFAILPLVR